MRSTRKAQRIKLLALGGVAMVAAAVLVAVTFDDTIAFFKSPSEIVAERPGPEQLLRVGGLVAEGSVVRGEGKTVSFDVTDGAEHITISYTGVLPDLFREGKASSPRGGCRARASLPKRCWPSMTKTTCPARLPMR